MKLIKYPPLRVCPIFYCRWVGQFRVDTKAAAALSAFRPETWSSLGILQQGGGSHDPWTEVGTDGSCRCMVLTLVARMSQMWCHCDTVPRSTTCPKSNAA